MSLPNTRLIETGKIGEVEWSICETPLGYGANGYVTLPKDHPWLIGVDEFWATMEHPADDFFPGGITYYSGNTLGFDTLHSWDVWPETDPPLVFEGARRWSVEQVIEETKRIAKEAWNDYKA